MRKVICHIFFLLVVGISSSAQDVHFGQTVFVPVHQNPANTGNYDGNYRFAGIYRNQWRSVTVPYVSTGISAELASQRTPDAKNRLGFGFQIIRDQAGDGNLLSLDPAISAAYYVKPKGDSGMYVGLGVNAGIGIRRIDYSAFTFDDQFDGDQFNPGLATNELFPNNSFSYPDLGLGFSIGSSYLKKTRFYLSAAILHINKPEQGFAYSSKKQLAMRNVADAGMSFPVSKLIQLEPGIRTLMQGEFSEIRVGGDLKFGLRKAFLNPPALILGGWYRTGDALIAKIGWKKDNLEAGISYDFTISNLQEVNNNKGGLEFGLVYIIKKVPKVNPNKAGCPVL